MTILFKTKKEAFRMQIGGTSKNSAQQILGINENLIDTSILVVKIPKAEPMLEINGVRMRESEYKAKQKTLETLVDYFIYTADTSIINKSHANNLYELNENRENLQEALRLFNKKITPEDMFIKGMPIKSGIDIIRESNDEKLTLFLKRNSSFNYASSISDRNISYAASMPDKPLSKFLGGVHEIHGYFEPIIKGDIFRVLKLADTKALNLTKEAFESTLKTAYGDVKVFLDLYDDNDAFNAGELSSNAMLFNFDSNGDGLLNSDDRLFDKLKVRGYDKEGNEKIAKLGDVVKAIDLEKFIKKEVVDYSRDIFLKDYEEYLRKAKLDPNRKTYAVNFLDKRLTQEASDPRTLFKAEYRYKEVDKDSLKSFFEANADADGWVDLVKDNELIFGTKDGFLNFAYLKKGLDGELRLEEFRPIYETDLNKKQDKLDIYSELQRKSFMQFYDDYQAEKKAHEQAISLTKKHLLDFNVENAENYIKKLDKTDSALMIAMQNDFERVTGLSFSEKNLETIKQAFLQNKDRAAAAMRDSDSVIAMKLNENGSITLKFNSGRELQVRELYTDTGKLSKTRDGKRVSLNLKAKEMKDDELNKLDFTKVAIKIENGNDEYISLKQLSTKAVRNLFDKGFLISLTNGKDITTKDIYNLNFVDDFLEFEKSKNSLTNKIKEANKFYQKLDKFV